LIHQAVFHCHCEHLKGARQSHTPHEIASTAFDSLAMTLGFERKVAFAAAGKKSPFTFLYVLG